VLVDGVAEDVPRLTFDHLYQAVHLSLKCNSYKPSNFFPEMFLFLSTEQCGELVAAVTELAMQRRRALSTTSSALLRRSASTNLTTSPAPAEKFESSDTMKIPARRTESS
jgi:hypothetical protein